MNLVNISSVRGNPSLKFSDVFRRPGSTRNASLGLDNLHFTYKARGAIEDVLEGLSHHTSRRTVAVPAFHCPTVVQPIIRAGFKVRYYSVATDLSISLESIKQEITDDVAAVIVVHYFGFRQAQIDSIASICETQDIVVIEDWAHSFLRANPVRLAGEDGDFAIYSLAKILPCGTGGAMRALKIERHACVSKSVAPAMDRVKLYKQLFEEAVGNLKPGFVRNLLLGLEKLRVRVQNRQGNSNPTMTLPSEPASNGAQTQAYAYAQRAVYFEAALPWFIQRIIKTADLDAVAARRRENFQAYLDGLSGVQALSIPFTSLDRDTVPWCFPVLLDDRTGKDAALRNNGVPLFTFGETMDPSFEQFAKTEFTKNEKMIKRARMLSNRMLCLPVHQNIEPNAIAQYCRLIEQTLANR